MPTAYIALGSNLGDRREYLERALQALRQSAGIVVTRVSPVYETEPVGGPAGQGRYLNAAAELTTDLGARQLMAALLAIEQGLGRVRAERDGPRTIDLDLLLYDQQVIDEPGLKVPHPRLHERSFVLRPLADIAPYAVHPVIGKTIAELAAPYSARSLPRELSGLRALVTGSTGGIGRAIALELAQAGADVIVHGRRTEALEAAHAEVRDAGVRAAQLSADLRHTQELPRLVDRAWSAWNGLDIWINNAGVDTLTGEAAKWTFERKLEELWAVDVRAAMFLARAVGARMKGQGRGVILNMGWDQAETGMEGDSGELFAAVKGAVMAFTKSLALSVAPEVRVNCLAPGWIRTAWGERASAQWQERARWETPLGRWGTPQDVARVARWLVSPAASFITGQVIRIDGGAVR